MRAGTIGIVTVLSILVSVAGAIFSIYTFQNPTSSSNNYADLVIQLGTYTPTFFYDYFSEKSLDYGSSTHMRDCEFYFECDCCAGNLLFNADSTFYHIDYCMGNITVLTGGYRIVEQRILALEYDGNRKERRYNWEREVDETAEMYYYTDTMFAPFSNQFQIGTCGENLALTNIENEGVSAITTNEYSTLINSIREENLIE
ncbi:MAG: hypothetical protein ACPG4Z_05550 [Chitinophagales bacterium]